MVVCSRWKLLNSVDCIILCKNDSRVNLVIVFVSVVGWIIIMIYLGDVHLIIGRLLCFFRCMGFLPRRCSSSPRFVRICICVFVVCCALIMVLRLVCTSLLVICGVGLVCFWFGVCLIWLVVIMRLCIGGCLLLMMLCGRFWWLRVILLWVTVGLMVFCSESRCVMGWFGTFVLVDLCIMG